MSGHTAATAARGRGRWGCHPIATGDIPPPKTGDRPSLGLRPRAGPRFRRFRRSPLVADSAHCRRCRGSVYPYPADVLRRSRLRSNTPPGCCSRRRGVGPRRGDTRPDTTPPKGGLWIRLGSVVSTSPTGRKGAAGVTENYATGARCAGGYVGFYPPYDVRQGSRPGTPGGVAALAYVSGLFFPGVDKKYHNILWSAGGPNTSSQKKGVDAERLFCYSESRKALAPPTEQ